MNWDALGAIGEIVGAFAVLVRRSLWANEHTVSGSKALSSKDVSYKVV